MLRKLFILIVCAVASASVPMFYERHPEMFHGLFKPAAEPQAPPTVASAEIRTSQPAEPSTEVLLGRKVRIDADQFGHFSADFRLNGRNVDAMVDTGATLVAMNASTARRVGIKVVPADFKYSVRTANGETRAAGAVIEKLQIGRILVEDVDAVVLEDKALDGTLIGVSFLNRLAKYQVENGSLLLEQ
ncbi:MAG: TIGR02281 family clan AA aspartic protease [Pseudomonadota bacterium]|nr:TIGR02281 family clan AA aspartic protease [Pseudomonadota bacterium]MDQ2705327.1 TIGR02281 family clan AA aspartic protease [Pseudomonadota bacterium]